MTEPARLPPPGLDGLDSTWSRLVTATDGDGVERTWHVLDRGPVDPRLTLLCVHGNPSWSYLFRHLLHDAPDDVRVVAVDHLDMGFSERTGTTRRLATRIDDLDRLTTALGVDGPVVTVAHDWGGPISLGWALGHREQLRGVVLMNTAVHQPAGSPAPGVIRLVRSRPVLHGVTTASTAFVRGAFELSDERPPADVRAGFLAPYDLVERRRAIGEFVADIPLEPDHPSAEALDAVAAGLADLSDVPALLLWGSADRVFSDLYLHDLEARLPHADVHRYPTAGHFVSEDTDCLDTALEWVARLDDGAPGTRVEAIPSTLVTRTSADPERLAIVEMSGASITAGELEQRVVATAGGLAGEGVASGERVALMIPPGIELATALLACWRIGAVVVLVDAGLGPRNVHAAVRSAAPDHIIGIPKALAAARALRWPGRRISSESLDARRRRALGAVTDLESVRRRSRADLPPPTVDDVAAVAFTSGATGPSKGVVYTHGAIAAQRDAIAATYGIGPDDRLVAAFAPFALFGPLLDIPSVVPDMDVTAPSTLTAVALADAVARVDATVVFASPAAWVNVVATADALTEQQRASLTRVRLVLSAGAPVRASLLESVVGLFPNAEAATPYGMTECLPVADITLGEIRSLTGDGDGVCVGRPVTGVDVMIDPLDGIGRPIGDPSTVIDVNGEVLVRAAHQRLRYDRLWRTTQRASEPSGWHRTGDVGHLDRDGRLWIGGRLGHVITTADGPVTPVRIETAVEALDDTALAAAVGVGPAGTQQLVVVRQPNTPLRSARLADLDAHDRVRTAVGRDVAAVFDVPTLPTDRRHNSKIDRGRLADWANDILAGGRVRNP